MKRTTTEVSTRLYRALATALCSIAITAISPLLASGMEPGPGMQFADPGQGERNSMFQPAWENLFTNLADLSTADANRLRLWPDRHWWFGLERRF